MLDEDIVVLWSNFIKFEHSFFNKYFRLQKIEFYFCNFSLFRLDFLSICVDHLFFNLNHFHWFIKGVFQNWKSTFLLGILFQKLRNNFIIKISSCIYWRVLLALIVLARITDSFLDRLTCLFKCFLNSHLCLVKIRLVTRYTSFRRRNW